MVGVGGFVAGGMTLWVPVAIWRRDRVAALAGTGFRCAATALVITRRCRTWWYGVGARAGAVPEQAGAVADKLLIVDQRVGSVVFYLKPEAAGEAAPRQMARAPWTGCGRNWGAMGKVGGAAVAARAEGAAAV